MVAPFRVTLTVLLFLAGLPLSAGLSLDPLGPVSGQPVTLRVPDNCGAGSGGANVTRDGTNVHVVMLAPGNPCPTPPFTRPVLVPLGAFDTGEYHVDVKNTFDASLGTLTFIVRDAAPHPDFAIHPAVVRSQPLGLRLKILFGANADPCGGDCATTTIDVGGATVPWSQLRDDSFDAPAHAPGLVDVRILNRNETITLPGAIYYWDGGEPDPSVFERVLFPVLFHSGGVGGSEWVSEAVIWNPTSWFIENANYVDPVVCLGLPCAERRSDRSRSAFSGEGHPHGIALVAPRNEAPFQNFNLRIRDTSRQAQGFGTEIPVVRESEMYRNTQIPLLEVPLDPRYRVTVRVYAFPDRIYDGYRNNSAAGIIRMNPLTLAFTRTVLQLDAPCNGGVCTATPLYGEFTVDPGTAQERTDLYIELPEGALGWAFASVTNNATQEVTLVTPNGRGGAPCGECR